MASSPYINHFIQPDSIIPNPADPQSWNRYSYVNNSPINYIDPSGHSPICDDPSECNQEPNKPLLIFETDPGEIWADEEMAILNAGAYDVANAFAGQINYTNKMSWKLGITNNYDPITPTEAFHKVFGGPITVTRVSSSCGCWAQNQGRSYGQYEIYVFGTTSVQDILLHPRLIVHEMGHTFYWAAGGYISGSSVGDRNGFHGPYFQWQFGLDSPEDLGTEIFADMFIGWVYGKWQLDPNRASGLAVNGEKKSAYMNKYMPLMIDNAINR